MLGNLPDCEMQNCITLVLVIILKLILSRCWFLFLYTAGRRLQRLPLTTQIPALIEGRLYICHPNRRNSFLFRTSIAPAIIYAEVMKFFDTH